ncbi:MAG: glycosyltransferase family 2 protein [Saprospiraceae bacterium]|nr:glycosyltransferase family 2 protein [Saprospiraceae bacterium]
MCVIVVLPAYNAAQTLYKTYHEIPHELVTEVILCDDFSSDHTSEVAHAIGIKQVIRHEQNRGYGANQKTLYNAALESGAEIVIMLHPDYQYNPALMTSMISLIQEGVFDMVMGSRILGGGALHGGMPMYKYIANRFLTLWQNVLLGEKLSEYHTGYRAYRGEVLRNIAYEENSDDFIFDNQILSQIILAGYRIGEISCPAYYDESSSSIGFAASVKYGFGVLKVTLQHLLQKWGILQLKRYGST